MNLFRDTDMDNLTVLNATQNGAVCEFVWTNDTLPKHPACPTDDIKRLMKVSLKIFILIDILHSSEM